MLKKRYLCIIIVIITFFSCAPSEKKTMTANDGSANSVLDNSIIDLTKHNKALRAKLVLYTQEKFSFTSNGEYVMRSITEGNFGIPDGVNWLVEWGWQTSDTTEVILYAINNDTIVKRYYLGKNQKWRNYSEFNIMDIVYAGVCLGDRSGTILYSGYFTDDNKYYRDGAWRIPADIKDQFYNNFFRYNFRDKNFGYDMEIEIFGYDKETDNIKTHLRISTRLIDRTKGPAPVTYTRYNGMHGVKVYIPESGSDGKWIFYIWDVEKRQFLEMGEIID